MTWLCDIWRAGGSTDPNVGLRPRKVKRGLGRYDPQAPLRVYDAVMALSKNQDAFVQWLLTPKDERNPRTQAALAEQLGVSPTLLTTWKSEATFLERWNAAYLTGVGSPERKSAIMETLYGTATDPDDPKHVQAAKSYFEIEGSLAPSGRSKVDITVAAKPVSDLSDAELERMLASKAGDELGRRRDASA